jgi:hypothetical protein
MKYLTHKVERVDPREYSLESREVSEERNVARDVLVIFSLLVLVYAAFAWLLPAVADAAPANGTVHRTLPLCLSDEGESAFPCVWVAFAQGDKQGHSFRIYRDGRVKLISDSRAFELAGECDSNGPLYCRTGS